MPVHLSVPHNNSWIYTFTWNVVEHQANRRELFSTLNFLAIGNISTEVFKWGEIQKQLKLGPWVLCKSQQVFNEVGRDSSVGIATRYGLDGPGIESRWGARFSAPVQTDPGVHPASCTVGTGSFSGVKRPGPGANHPPPSSVPRS